MILFVLYGFFNKYQKFVKNKKNYIIGKITPPNLPLLSEGVSFRAMEE